MLTVKEPQVQVKEKPAEDVDANNEKAGLYNCFNLFRINP